MSVELPAIVAEDARRRQAEAREAAVLSILREVLPFAPGNRVIAAPSRAILAASYVVAERRGRSARPRASEAGKRAEAKPEPVI